MAALYGDRLLNRGFAVLAIDGPGQYEAPMLGIYFSTDNWVATGKPIFDWLGSAARGRRRAHRLSRAELRHASSAPCSPRTSRASAPAR